jgi:hypothetical protein
MTGPDWFRRKLEADGRVLSNLGRNSPGGQDAMSRKQYIITLNPDADPDRVAAELKGCGMEVENVMREIGVISATGEAGKVHGLEGIAAVEESGGYQIPPPDSPIQ